MALTKWKKPEESWLEPIVPSRELLPYWRRRWLDDFGIVQSRINKEFYDWEGRLLDAERRWHDSWIEVYPTYDDYGFKLSMDLSDFLPSEITVKTNENSILIEGSHEEWRWGRRYVSRRFSRRYHVPLGYDANSATSEMSSNGILTVKAPKIHERIVSVKPTYRPAVLDKKVRF